MEPIAIIDYGMGNLGSVLNMFKRVGAPAFITSSATEIAGAKKLLLPGVGAFGEAMRRINDSGLRSVLDQKALVERVPVLGICLGMQLLTRSSEEGSEQGLGWLPAETLRFPKDSGLKVPHMGWNRAHPEREHPLVADLGAEPRFYFVHSYYVRADQRKDSLLTAHYGIEFDAGIGDGNIWGVQFHPEKSHRFGKRLLTNFAEIRC